MRLAYLLYSISSRKITCQNSLHYSQQNYPSAPLTFFCRLSKTFPQTNLLYLKIRAGDVLHAEIIIILYTLGNIQSIPHFYCALGT